MKIDMAQQSFIDHTLRDILIWIEKETGFEFTITSIYRDRDKGVHGTIPVRGVDLRCRYRRLVGDSIQSIIDENWQYDNTRPDMSCCLLHGEGSNLHLHIQVHPNTKKI